MTRIQWQGPHLLWLAMLALVVALAAVAWLYRPQIKTVPFRWGWLLLGLRSTALGVLAVSILRPVILRPLGTAQRGMVAIVIDQSRSMSTVDARSPAQLVQLAAALGAVAPEDRPAPVSDLRRDVNALRQLIDEIARAHSELDYARLAGRGIESAQIHLREVLAQFAAGTKGLTEKTGASPVTAPLVQIVSQIGGLAPDPPEAWARAAGEGVARLSDRIDAIEASADEQVYRDSEPVRIACDELARQPRIELVRRGLIGPSGLLSRLGSNRPVRVFGFSRSIRPLTLPLTKLQAGGTYSDLTGAMQELGMLLAGQNVSNVILFSDGREAGGRGGTGTAGSDAPIIAVAAAGPLVRDLSIARVSLPSSAFVGESIDVVVEVKAIGLNGSSAQVVIETSGRRASRAVPIDADGARIELPVKLDRPGPQELTIRLMPQPGEVSDRNNQVRRVVKVLADQLRVVLFGRAASRDYQYLRAAVAGTPGFVAIDRPIDRPGTDVSSQKLLDQDLVILSDVPADALSPAQWDAISRLVSERGGSVILVAADPQVISSYAEHPIASSLLPWRGDAQPAQRVGPGELATFHVVPAGSGGIEALKLADDADVSQARWNRLPGVSRFLAMPPLKLEARPLLVERESGLPVLTESALGAGRVLLLGLNETWRWRGALGDRDQDRFWLQLMRHAVQEPYAVSDGGLQLDADRLEIEPGESFRVRAAISKMGDMEEQFPLEPPTLQVFRGWSLVRAEPLSPQGMNPDRFQAVLTDLPAGDYELRLTAADRSISLPVRVADGEEIEMRDVSGDPANLRRLVRPRGTVLNMSEVRSLPQMLEAPGESEPSYTEMRLWDSPYLFLFVLGALGVEWAVRMRVGLA